MKITLNRLVDEQGNNIVIDIPDDQIEEYEAMRKQVRKLAGKSAMRLRRALLHETR